MSNTEMRRQIKENARKMNKMTIKIGVMRRTQFGAHVSWPIRPAAMARGLLMAGRLPTPQTAAQTAHGTAAQSTLTMAWRRTREITLTLLVGGTAAQALVVRRRRAPGR